MWQLGTNLVLCRLAYSQCWCGSRSLPGPFAASFATMAHCYACLALQNVLGLYRASKRSKDPTEQFKTMCFLALAPRHNVKNKFGPTLHPFLDPKGRRIKDFWDIQGVEMAETGFKIGAFFLHLHYEVWWCAHTLAINQPG